MLKALKKLTFVSICASSIPEEPGRQEARGSENNFDDHVVNHSRDEKEFEDPVCLRSQELRLSREFVKSNQHPQKKVGTGLGFHGGRYENFLAEETCCII